MKNFFSEIKYILMFAGICAVFFYQIFLRGLLPVPTDTLIGLYHPWRDLYAQTYPRGVTYKNFLITDPVRQQIPWRKLAIDDLKKGRMLSWNPYNFSGSPLLANIQAGALYPLNILFFLMPFPAAWTALVVLQPLLAGIFLYLYLRSKKIHPLVSLAAATAWSFSGFFIAWLTWGTIDQSALWLPLILLSVDHILGKSKRLFLWVLTLVISLTLSILAGHIQVAFYVAGFATVYTVFKLCSERSRGWWVLGGSILAIFVASVQIVPFASFLQHTSRLSESGSWLKDGWFLPWQHLVQFIAPDFFGNPATLNYWGVWNYGEFVGYIGILPLIFALFAFTRRDRLSRFYQVALCVILLFLLPTPLARIPYQFAVPILSALQPTRLMVLVDFCLVILMALGFDHFVKNRNKKIIFAAATVALFFASAWGYVYAAPEAASNIEISKRNLILPSTLFVASAAIVLMFLFIKKGKTIILFLAFALVSFDVIRFGWKFTPFTPVSYFFPPTKTTDFLKAQQGPFRIASLDAQVLPPNTNAYYGLESVEGYDPIYDSRYEEFIAALNRNAPNIDPPFGFNRILTISRSDSPLLRLTNAKYVLSKNALDEHNFELMYQEGETKVYWYKKALPRVFPVDSVKIASSKQEAINALFDPAFNAAGEAVVEASLSVAQAPVSPSDSIRVTSWTGGEMQFTTSMQNEHFIVILNSFDAGWHATVDGERTKIYRADYAFSGLVVPAGIHSVAVRFF